MTDLPRAAPVRIVAAGPGRMQATLQPHGALEHLRCGDLQINLLPASALEAGLSNLWLRFARAGGGWQPHPLLGPAAAGRQHRAGGRVWQAGVVERLEPGSPAGAASGQVHDRVPHQVPQRVPHRVPHRVHYQLQWVPAADADAWFWHLALQNIGSEPLSLDVLWLQDLALAPWPALRLNEAYVSQYLDHQPLAHPRHGSLLATRQAMAVAGRVPWLLCGSLGRAVAHATDAWQVLGQAARAGVRHGLLEADLPASRLQHEHALAALQEQAITLAPGQRWQGGFFGWLEAHHPAASSPADLALLERVLALPEALPPPWPDSALAGEAAGLAAPAEGAARGTGTAPTATGSAPATAGVAADPPADPRSLFSSAPVLAVRQPDEATLQAWCPGPWRHVDRGADGRLLSWFADSPQAGPLHGVTRDEALRVLRPHGLMLRSQAHWSPDETALASTVWMAGVFHSSLTQGHASANRLLSTQRGWLGIFRAQGLRLFADAGQGWQLLDLPSAFCMATGEAAWLYLGEHGLQIEVRARTAADAPVAALQVAVRGPRPVALLACLHIACHAADGHDDGLAALPAGVPVALAAEDDTPAARHWRVRPAPGSALAARLAQGAEAGADAGADAGALHVRAWAGQGLTPDVAAAGQPPAPAQGPGGVARAAPLQVQAQVQAQVPVQVQDDAALFLDGASRGLPWLCLHAPAARALQLELAADLIRGHAGQPAPLPGPAQPPLPQWQPPDASQGAGQALQQLADWLPWLGQNALIHYLAPRGLEQFSGGGWGTRDVCQGPVELLLAIGRFDALRDLLLRVFAAQNPDGDWPQWFMFYPRDAHIRAGDSHGDIVFWPLVALGQYLLATGDAALLALPLPFHGDAPGTPPQPLQAHVERALAVVQARTIAGTRLAAYGHGDWNDALQPADPALREHLCSAWTVTLHHRMLRGLAEAWRHIGRGAQADAFDAEADAVAADFRRLLLVDGVLTGYARMDPAAPGQVAEWLLHPRDARTGIRHSALAMVHAIADELFSPEEAADHLALVKQHLMGPDGLRLFDRPLRYTGGTMQLFQRGESAAYFGREIGLMYMHAHLRWAEALARLGRADDLLHALRLANPIAIEALVPQAAPRQRNCYYSSSDAAFADRETAWAQYGRIAEGTVALEGGWRVYSSGAGIAWRLVWQHLLGLVEQQHRLGIDPVLPAALDGLQVRLPLYGHWLQVQWRVGPRGHGPTALALDGVPLACTPGRNRYRAPGVWVPAAPLRAALAAGAQRLEITLG